MTATKELQALLERVEAATGPDREIDAALAVALLFPKHFKDETVHARPVHRDDGCAPGTYWYVSFSGKSLHTSAVYTASIDATLALVERVMPGTEYEITNLYGVASASLPMNDSMLPYETGRNECGNLPLAVLAALLKALVSQSEEKGE